MKSSLADVFKGKNAEAILDELSVRIYEPPLSALRDLLRELPPAIQIPMLVIDFNTEVEMQGMLGFLENSTGLYLDETIDALRLIGSRFRAEVLENIRSIMARHAVTPARLRADFDGSAEFDVTSFAKLHGEHLNAMANEIEAEAGRLRSNCDENLFELLGQYIEENKTALLTEIRRCASGKQK
ncbi:MAG TPA: hypothetical protein VFE47_25095 [Tepidisphaeraceae bacterium]|jgi:hypothetical protein|nr:hypothetical protein [Tepidisphaeraceae bacterium]